MAIAPIPGPYVPGVLETITAEVSGQSLADAWDSKITGKYDPYNESEVNPGIGFGNYTTDKPSITGDTSSSIQDSSQSDPLEAWEDQVDAGSDVSKSTGGLVDGSDVSTVNFSLLDNGDSIEAVQPIAVDEDYAAIAIAQALGVSIKYSDLSPVIKGKLIASLAEAGVVYNDARNKVMAWRDKVGNVLFPKSAIDAIAGALTSEDIPVGPPSDQKAYSDFFPNGIRIFNGFDLDYISSGVRRKYTCSHSGYWIYYSNDIVYHSAVKTPGVQLTTHYSAWYPISSPTPTQDYDTTWTADSNPYTVDGKSAYNITLSARFSRSYLDADDSDILPQGSDSQAAWTFLYGTISGGGEYPEGTSSSLVDKYTADTIPVVGGIAVGAALTQPVVAVNLPENSEDTTESEANPISSTDDDIINNLPAPPIPLPIPDTNVSNPDVPLVDSSVVDSTLVNELVEELANTLDPQAPQSSGIIPFPPLPSIGGQYPSIVPASGSGLIHVYNPTPGEMVSFGNWLWVTYADATIDKIWNNPFDGIIGAFELYSTPQTDGIDNIRSGFLTCPTTAKLVRQRYTEIDCGTVIVPEFYGNYLDYSPYSQAYIYLPFIGINEVSIDDIVGHAINIRYRIDAYNGSCIAMIYVAKNGYRNLCYQFAGNCAVEVPLAGGSQAAIKAGVLQAEAYARASLANAAISAASQIGAGIASGSVAGIVMGALGGLGTAAAGAYGASQSKQAARVANKSTVQHSGQFGASHGAMGLKIPHIIIRNPIQVKVVNYNEDYGFPAHKRVIVGGCRGYLRVREVNVISAHATDDEKALIEALLKNGVYVS